MTCNNIFKCIFFFKIENQLFTVITHIVILLKKPISVIFNKLTVTSDEVPGLLFFN
jgi:hypothetical protein